MNKLQIESSTIFFQKNELRQKAKNLLKTYSIEKLEEKSKKICNRILNWEFFIKATNIFFFMPLKSEPNILEIIENSLLQNKSCFIPKVNQNGTMDFYKLDNDIKLKNQVEIGKYNILEPRQNLTQFDTHFFLDEDFSKQNNIIFIPATAFDKNKNRIGKGKGFYDKFLSKITIPYKAKTIFVGISFNFLIFDKVPVEQTDIKMDFIITEEKIL